MNYKSLLFTALAGVMITSACVKNLESPSVTKVREAKAAEMEAAAALNKANAEATVTLANANAALTLAKAEVEKANAAKIAAETELVRINAELARVNVEIAKVRVEEEKVQLEILKEQLEQAKLRTEQEKAYAEYLLKQYEQQMQHVIDQMELDALYHQIEMAKALDKLNDSLAEIDAENREAIANLYKKIAETQEAILKKEVEILKAEMTAELMEAGLTTAEEALNAELAKKEMEIYREQLYLDYLKEAQGTDSETLKTVAQMAYVEYLRVLEQQSVDFANYLGASEAYDTAYNDARYDKFYEYYYPIRSSLMTGNLGAMAADAGLFFNYDSEEHAFFVEDEDGAREFVMPALYQTEDYSFHFDGRLDTETMTAVGEKIQANITNKYLESLKTKQEYWAMYYDKEGNYAGFYYNPLNMTPQEFYDFALGQYNLMVEANKETKEAFEKAVAEYDAAEEAYAAATEARKMAYVTWRNNGGESAKVDEYESALDDYEQYYKNYYEPAQVEFGKHPSVDAAKDALHEANKAVIAAGQAYEKAYADAEKPLEKKNKAESAMTDSLTVAQTLEAAYQAALDAQRAAELTYLENPKSETAKKAFEDAKKATAEALKAADDAQAAYAEAKVAYNKAAADYAPYEEAIKTAMKSVTAAGAAQADAEAEVDACKEAKANWEMVQNDIKGLEENLDKAYAAMVAEEGNEYYLAYYEACKAETVARDIRDQKESEIYSIYYPAGDISTLKSQADYALTQIEELGEEREAALEAFAAEMDKLMEYLENEDAFIEAIDTYNEANTALVEAYEIYAGTSVAASEWEEKYLAFETAADSAESLEAEIAASEAKIAAIVAEMEELIDEYNEGVFSVLYFEEHIKVLEAELAGLELQLEGYQAELEARLANL